ncbi:MAG TPA: PilZ domain-containing protein [Polyangiales bacterium]|nr:PilZ domain-containing protein [Polyangiales bacterium]
MSTPEPDRGPAKHESGVRSVVKRLRANHGQAWVITNGRKVPVRLLGAADNDQLSWASDEAVESGPVKLEFSGPAIGYHAQLVSHGEQDGSLVTSVPTHFESVRVRREPRFPAPTGVQLCLRHAEATFPLVNLSDRGLQFRTDCDVGFLQLGERLEADVTFMGALRVQLTLTVRHVTSHLSERAWTVGGSLAFAASEDESRWHEQVDLVRHSLTQVGKLYTRDMWDLFDAAGYFGLSSKSTGEFARYRQSFERCSRYLSGQPEQGVQVVFPSSRGIEATASAVAEAEDTAVIYHVAKRPGDDPRGIGGKIVLRSVYEHALTWAQRRHVQWVSAWVQDVTRFSCGLHRDFCAAHAGNGASGVFTFRALEIAAHAEAPHDPRYELADAGQELEHVLSVFRARHPQPIGDARAWHPAAFVNPSSPFGRSMPRERRVIVARHGGQLRAAAVLECAQPGLHLFGIFDSCYVVSFDGDDSALGALLNEASRWYAARAKTHFVYASDELTRQVPMARDLGVTHESIFRVDLISKFLEHLWQLTAEGT